MPLPHPPDRKCAAFVNTDGDAAIAALRVPDGDNIIFGAGMVGVRMLDACRRLGIRITAFCDNDRSKNRAGGIPVLSVETASRDFAGANFILALLNPRPALEQLGALGVPQAFSAGLLRRDPVVMHRPDCFGQPFAEYHTVMHTIARQQALAGHLDGSAVSLPCLDVMVTELCTLNCTNCSSLIPYYRPEHHPAHRRADDIVKELQALSSCVDRIFEVVLMGGETLLHPEYHLLAARIARMERVDSVCVLANGTIRPLPEHLSVLADRKIYFRVSDYGRHSPLAAETAAILADNGIAGYLQTYAAWARFLPLPKRGLGRRDLESAFRTCLAPHCYPLRDGKLHRCEFVPNAMRVGAIPDEPGNRVDLAPFMQGERTAGELAAAIDHFAHELSFMPACDYCPGYTRNDECLPPAEQCPRTEAPGRGGPM